MIWDVAVIKMDCGLTSQSAHTIVSRLIISKCTTTITLVSELPGVAQIVAETLKYR